MSLLPTNNPASVQGHSLRYYAWLAFQLARRDIAVRYRGTSLGWLWALFTPLLMLGVYTLAFKYIFKVRWPGVGDSPVDFALQLFAGLIIFQAAADCWSRSSRIISEQPNLVKKVVFPLALLPWAPVLNAVFHAGVSMVLLLLVTALWGFSPSVQWCLLPLLLLPLAFLLWSVSLLLATLGVFMRDLTQVVSLVIGLLQFLTPIFYPSTSLPPFFQGLLAWNPLTVFIEQVRAIVFNVQGPTFNMWLQSLAVSAVFSVLAYAIFRRVRGGFADVI